MTSKTNYIEVNITAKTEACTFKSSTISSLNSYNAAKANNPCTAANSTNLTPTKLAAVTTT